MQNVLSDQELARALSYDLKMSILGGKKFYRRKLSSGSGRFSGGKFQHFSGGKNKFFQGKNSTFYRGKYFSPIFNRGKYFSPYFKGE